YDISLYDFSQRIRSQDEMTPEQKEAIQKQNEEREPLREEIFSRIRKIDTLKTSIIIVNAEDFHKVARIIGVTSLNIIDDEKAAGEMKFDGKGTQSSYNAQGYSTSLAYYQLHSNDLKKTKEYVNRVFGGLENPVEASDGRITSRGEGAIITPEYRFRELFKSVRRTVWKLFIAWTVVLGLMCVCMLFIMKSNIMNRTREIGIYRAIGVSGKNILFRFAVEIGVVVTFSVFIGYLLSSVIVRFILKHGGMAESLLYYPWWLALLVLGFLYAVCIVCGIFPVWRILRKTPSEILAKYDI
ncbi:MAG: ABC transporter permease, partial [Lachnospiraceae bacterium]|nr:ABC transporter permease [Lachnospiraceae bacterium]